ncbi:phenylacetic acid degradation protein PaaN [Amorphus orientalis]|uniref:Phenylacetic acid degradation protein paaN n=1 Tax=Amorphus orientalis TaxID=649198 RepID=A0AAE4AUT8_9HYPH|nr:phenylacetic acid degradation protein PaaN [Amorphus orientalis]MDQ0316094.1 phenylacetic acid degradation protein paaN [Amorphus orientalis]
MSELFDRHRETLKQAVEAAHTRGYWSPYPEMPSGKIYGETAKADGEAAFKAMLDAPFDLDQPTTGKRVGKEESPYGFKLGTTYPAVDVDQLVSAAKTAGKAWAQASVETRVGVCLEVLARINRQSFAMASAVMHTSGQAWMMAFQAGGPHAQDRGLEAVAYAYEEMSKIPGAVRWEKPQGKNPPAVLDKTFKVIPRGIGLVIGCATFPNWNSYSAYFADLATGNAVIVKPHPMAILPLALTVKITREVLAEQGFDPNVALLAPDEPDAPITKELVAHPEIGIIDFTGSRTFGDWIRQNAAGKLVYTEETGVNSVVALSTDSFKGMCGNIAFSLSLYSGQMCTAPQNVFVPRDGIETDEGHKSVDEVAEGIGKSLAKLLGDPDRAMGILGAVQNPDTLKRIEAARGFGRVVHESAPVTGDSVPEGARTATPLLVQLDAGDEAAYLEERFGPIAFVIAATDGPDAIRRAAGAAKTKGAITASIYSTDDGQLAAAEEAFAEAGAPLSENLTGQILVNQSAAFSDFHVSGANPAGTASLTDAAFVANRFRVATVRRQAA